MILPHAHLGTTVEPSDLPETWQRDLEAKRAADRKPSPSPQEPKPRTPIQPVFKLRWGILAFLLPAAALFAAAGWSQLFRFDFPNWSAGVIFYALLCGGSGLILSHAIGLEHRHSRFAAYCALAGILSLCVFLIPGAAEVYVAFLLLYLLTRAVAIAGVMSLLVFVVGIGLAIFFVAVLNRVLEGAVLVVLDSSAARLTLGLIAAGPLAHSLCTAALPAERTFFGRLDAMLTGIAASLLGMFAALVLYRTVMAGTGLALEFAQRPMTSLIQLGIAAGALAIGNWLCVRQLFRFAYTAREDRPVLPRRKKLDSGTMAAAHYPVTKPQPVRVSVDDDADVEEAT